MTHDENTTATEPATTTDAPAEADKAEEATTPEVRHSTVNAAFVARLKAALAA